MRSILVLLILVMIGLNGKGQSVTALPDSVLSQCCLEVTLLNGNVTTVDWVFIQYITRDGTGTKLFVEYAPNFGGIQWETQIRIQDDFDDVIERSKFIILPFTVGSTDYGIHRNWIANIEENTTTGGTWIYGRFGTPTKRKFSAVEDYETLKNLLLACRPRAIVVAENGLYTEGDTVRMGGFLIENTTITTEGYNWQMKDTLSSVEFGLDYLTPETLDTTVYWGRRSGSVRQMVQLGRRYYYNSMRDTTGGLYSDFTHSWNSGDPFLQYQTFNPSAPTTGTAWFKVQKDNSFLNLSNDATNPYYSLGWAVTNSTATLGASESGSGDPGNGVVMGAYGFGTTEYLFMKTKAVDAGTATNGQFLQLIDNSSGEVDFATIDLSGYLEIGDTNAMLTNYPSTAGYGIIDGGKTWRVDTTSPNGLSTRLFAKTLPTSILTTQIAVSNGNNLVGYSGFTYSPYFATQPSSGTISARFTTSASRGIDFDFANGIDKPTIQTYGGVSYLGLKSTNLVLDGTVFLGASTSAGTFLTTNGMFMTQNGRQMLFNQTSSNVDPNTKAFVFRADGAVSGNTRFFEITRAGVNLFNIQGGTGNVLIGTTTDVPTSILTARSTTKSSSPFPLHTLAESDAITGVQGNFDYETTQNGLRWYNGTRKAYALESTFARGTSGQVPYFNTNGQLAQDALFWDETNNRLGIGGSPANNLRVVGTSRFENGGYLGTSTNRAPYFYAFTTSNGTPDATGTNIVFKSFTTNESATAGNIAFVGSTMTHTSGAQKLVTFEADFLPASGTAQYTTLQLGGAIIQSGGASGATRGLLVSQSVGGAVNYRAIELTNTVGFGIYAPINTRNSLGLLSIGTSLSNSTSMLSTSWTGTRQLSTWTTTGANFDAGSISTQDLTGTGTIATRVLSSFSGGVLSSTNAVTVTTAANVYISGAPTAGTNTTIINPLALLVGNGNTNLNGQVGIKNNAPARDLDVNGEVRIRDLITDAPVDIVGADADGDLGAVSISTDLKLSSGSLGLKRKSLIDSLPAASVTIDANGNDLIVNDLYEVGFETTSGSSFGMFDDDVFYVTAQYGVDIQEESGSRLTMGGNAFNLGSRIYNGSYTAGITGDSTEFNIRSIVGGIEKIHLNVDFAKDINSHSLRPYNKYGLPNLSPGSGDKIMLWSTGTPSFVSTSSFANGIYSGSGTLSQTTTRARIPDNGNLLFSQLFNSSADSMYLFFRNNGGGERSFGFGLTDTLSGGYSKAEFSADGSGVMNWEFSTSDGVFGNTTVKAFEGDLDFSVNTGNIGLTTPVGSEIRMTGLVRAKQEAYYEINSTSSPQTFSNTYSDNYVNQGSTQASFTFLFPASPEDGQILMITWGNAISAVTLDGNGNTITGTAVTTATAGTRRMFKFYGSSNEWVKIF